MRPSLSRAAEPAHSTAAPLSLVCPACEQGNPAGARFCNACGAPVHLRPCPACEAINDGAAGHCYRCAAALSPAVSPSPVAEPTDAGPNADFPYLAAVRECPRCDAINDGAAIFCHRCEAALADVGSEVACAGTEAACSEALGLAAGETVLPTPVSPEPHAMLPHDAIGGHAGAAVEEPGRDVPSIEQAVAREPWHRAGNHVLPADAAEAPVHFIGGLSAPLDEAELPMPEPRRWRAGWVLASMAALLVVPVVSAISWHASEHPGRVAQAVERLRAATVALLAHDAPPQAADPAPTAPAPDHAEPPARPAASSDGQESGADRTAGSRATEPSVGAPPTAAPVHFAAAADAPRQTAKRAAPHVAKAPRVPRPTVLRPVRATSTRAVHATDAQPISQSPKRAWCTAAAAANRHCRAPGPFASN